jgi:ribose transport system permease protein
LTQGTRKLNLGFDRFSGLYLWAIFIIVFSIWVPNSFLTSSTLHSVASQQAIAAMVGLAVLIPLCAGQFDLSVGANANLTGIIAIILQVRFHWSVVPAILIAVAAGILIGMVNAFVVVRLHVSSFIATLGMGSILAAFEVIVSSNQLPAPVTASAWIDWTQKTIFGFQIVVLYLFVLALIVWWFLEHTPAGRYIYATGGNPEAARLSGVNVDRWSAATLIASGGIAGLAGVLYTSLAGPSLDFGSGLLLPAFAAAFLGSTQLKPGKFNVWGLIIAIYVLATGVEGIQLISGQQWISSMFNGVALILAVALAANNQRRVSSGRRRSAGSSQGDGAAPDAENVSPSIDLDSEADLTSTSGPWPPPAE